MLFLLPPSETKALGGGSLTIEQAALTFGSLNSARELVLGELLKLCKKPKVAAATLKLSPKQLGEIQVNLEIPTAPTMRALERYTGTLFDAIEAAQLDDAGWLRAKQTLLIQTALFGLIPSTDLIPNYRLSAGTNLPKANLKKVWSDAHLAVWPRLTQAPIIDLRSKAYADLAPIPEGIESYWLEVVSRESDGKLRALNHFNKLAKGLLIGAVLRSKKAPESIKDLAAIAKGLDMELFLQDGNLILVTDQIVKAKR